MSKRPAPAAAPPPPAEPIDVVLPGRCAFDPANDAACFSAIPGKWCVALLENAAGEPLQLLCAKNLRATLRRRLEAHDDLPSKRVDYRELVRSIRWRRVDSEFEMDLVYVDAARGAFPLNWRRLVPERSAYFVAIDANDRAPDFVRGESPNLPGEVFGPFADKAKADRWADGYRDAFELCRYRQILAQAPNGRACAYKQMNKCPAPCDGSISMDDFRANNVRPAIAAARDSSRAIAAAEAEMRTRAASLEFEAAGRAKGRASALRALNEGVYTRVRPIEAFAYVAVLPAARKGTAKLFLATATGVAEVAGVIADSCSIDDVIRLIASAVPRTAWPEDLLLGTICFHVGGAKTSARFVERARLDPATLATMLKSAMKTQPETDDAEPVRETRLAPVG